ncbi:hypothetical protein [Flavobacterium sp.]|uniref:hypothetical protein n=1 Tax=Flavobacterium sp. TaxID=239 RepID=UPI002FDED544
MKKNYLLLILLSSLSVLGQVGIGTTNPQETLHIGGNTSTIRVEGLDVINNDLNLGPTKLTPVYVDNQGNFTLEKRGYSFGGSGNILPLNFLQYSTNFIPNNPLGLPAPFDKYGVIINSDLTNESQTGLLERRAIAVPTNSMIEVKYAVSLCFSSTNLAVPPHSTYITDKKTRVIQTYFCIDINSDGLSADEENLKYGVKGQYYASDAGGTRGYPYMNSQGYVDLPAGNHTIYFYGVVIDAPNTFTSVGFGGANEYLKIRLYN